MQQDPDYQEISVLVGDKEAATEWARNAGLIANQIGNDCTLTPNCTGVLYHARVRGRPNMRCPVCKRYRSVYNSPALFGGANTDTSRLCNVDRHGRPQTTLASGVRIGMNSTVLMLW